MQEIQKNIHFLFQEEEDNTYTALKGSPPQVTFYGLCITKMIHNLDIVIHNASLNFKKHNNKFAKKKIGRNIFVRTWAAKKQSRRSSLAQLSWRRTSTTRSQFFSESFSHWRKKLFAVFVRIYASLVFSCIFSAHVQSYCHHDHYHAWLSFNNKPNS